jgi:uncharacterized SAM-binding protein YcdF (DUF218 family)
VLQLTLLIVAGGAVWLLVPPGGGLLPEPADAIVLLSGNIRERVPTAAFLAEQGVAGRILLTNDGVFSRWSQKYQRNLYQQEWAEEALVERGVPRDRIVKLRPVVHSTMQEAVVVSGYARGHGLKRIVVVTSDFHVRRAGWAFRRAGSGEDLRVSVCPAPTGGGSVRDRALEAVKLCYYVCRYGLPGTLPGAGGTL